MEPILRASATPSQPHRIRFVLEGASDPFAHEERGAAELARGLAQAREFTGAAGQLLWLPTAEGQRVWAGLGKPEAVTRMSYGEVLAKAVASLREGGAHRVSVVLPPDSPWSVRDRARYAAEALWMSAYSFDRHQSRAKTKPRTEIELVHADHAAVAAGAADGETIGRAICLARDLVNEPAAIAHPRYLAERAKEVAARVGARARLIEGEELEKQGFGAIWAVGRAAEQLPVLAALEWGAPGEPALVLAGKGVTFDSGGLDLKPSTAMALMKKDMGGAATVLGAFQAIAELNLPLHIVCVLALAENAVGPRSYRPGDVVKSKTGLTIEITNTDAEGRVVLADALALAREYNPRWMIDFATLTGACRAALGKDIMGLFCDDKALTEALQAAADATGEAVWPLPLWAPYKKKLESPVADLINATTDGMAGAVTAALFLQEFAGTGAWAHLDFYAWSEGESPLFPKGGSGAGVRLLVELAQRLSQGANA
jgi:leucyl aminopeptidase